MAKRMFVALDLPAPITAVLAALNPGVPGLRWLPADQLHLTLCFLAEVPNDHLQPLIDALAGIRVPSFQIDLEGLGCFARYGQPAVVWAGVKAASPWLLRLQRWVCAAVRATGMVPPKSRFHPHVTVGRCRDLSDSELRPLLTRHRHTDFGSFEVTGLTLYTSVLRPGGPEHQPVYRHGLGT